MKTFCERISSRGRSVSITRDPTRRFSFISTDDTPTFRTPPHTRHISRSHHDHRRVLPPRCHARVSAARGDVRTASYAARTVDRTLGPVVRRPRSDRLTENSTRVLTPTYNLCMYPQFSCKHTYSLREPFSRDHGRRCSPDSPRAHMCAASAASTHVTSRSKCAAEDHHGPICPRVAPYSCEDCFRPPPHVTAVDLHVPLGCAVALEVRADCMR